ncbi:MAG: PKD domain-containing protein [Candidatus Bathyarchaeum sp.]|nr:MAG: PKD domain-containing protein [Candidatus Bathyarchaeum sp.]
MRRIIRRLVTLSLISLLLFSVSFMLSSVMAWKAPKIVSVTRSPETPNYDQAVTIIAKVIPQGTEIGFVILKYRINCTDWIKVTMNLEDPEEGIYVAEIPAQPYKTRVGYKIYAHDINGYYRRSDYYSYVVCDFVPPVISDVLQVPTSPLPDETVTVSANVIEPPEASGVKNVTLWYTTDDVWSFLEMVMQNGLWTAIIPGQSEGVDIRFFIEAFDNAGNSAATSIFDYTVIIPNYPPVADFSVSASTVFTGEMISFDASGSYDPDGTIVSYFWEFGDGDTATGVSVDHLYVENGSYFVTLRVEDDDGAVNEKTVSILVKNRPPVAIIVSTEIIYRGEPIFFDASQSYDADGSIVSYFWDFGDGDTASGVSVSHLYLDYGTYIVTLTVTDDDGATGTANVTKIVQNHDPIASFTESASTVNIGEVIDFDASGSYDPDGTIVSYFWEFGDGTTATGVTVSHAYADDGSYLVTLTVTDNEGATDTASATKTVLTPPVPNQNPIASFTESASTVNIGEIIYFDASESYDPDGTIVSYFWNFGDGNTGTGVTVSHSYSDSGTYTVTLTVTDDDEATDTASATKTVLSPVVPNQKPVASFTESAETVYTGESIFFNASESYDPDGTIVTYHWNFGDGITATGVTVSHDYADDGSYRVTLTVTDDDGATDTARATKTVLNREPVASFTMTVGTVYTGEAVSFETSGSYDPDGTIVTYHWEFGDGTTGNGASVSHSYAGSGTYTITLTVTDDDGATDTASATKTVLTRTVLNQEPVASFTESASTVNTGEVIYFDASGSYDSDGTIIAYLWYFGDGDTAVGVEVDHTYEDEGIYTVTLTVIDNNGATDSSNSTKNVWNRPPLALFTENATTVTTEEIIHFDASGSYDPDGTIVSYHWDFGDGNTTTGVTSTHAYNEAGNYTVTLTVTDDDGASSSESAMKIVEVEEETANGALSLSFLSAIGLSVMALTVTLLYGLFIRRRKKGKT